jgi:hypothetical protein
MQLCYINSAIALKIILNIKQGAQNDNTFSHRRRPDGQRLRCPR